MVPIGYIRRRAYENRGRTVGRAFCRALGIRTDRGPEERRRRPRELAGMGWCFRNYGSPMDGRR